MLISVVICPNECRRQAYEYGERFREGLEAKQNGAGLIFTSFRTLFEQGTICPIITADQATIMGHPVYEHITLPLC